MRTIQKIISFTILLIALSTFTIFADDTEVNDQPFVIKYDQFYFNDNVVGTTNIEVNGRYFIICSRLDYNKVVFEVTATGLVPITIPPDIKKEGFFYVSKTKLGLGFSSDDNCYILNKDNTSTKVTRAVYDENYLSSYKSPFPYQIDLKTKTGYYEASNAQFFDSDGQYHYIWLKNNHVYRSENLVYWELINQLDFYDSSYIGKASGYSYYIVTPKKSTKPMIYKTKNYIDFEIFDGLPNTLDYSFNGSTDIYDFITPLDGTKTHRILDTRLYHENGKYQLAILHGASLSSMNAPKMFVFESSDLINWQLLKGYQHPIVEKPNPAEWQFPVAISSFPLKLSNGEFWLQDNNDHVFHSKDLATWTYDATTTKILEQKSTNPSLGDFCQYYEYKNGTHYLYGYSGLLTTKDFKSFNTSLLDYTNETYKKNKVAIDTNQPFDRVYIGTDRLNNKTILTRILDTSTYSISTSINNFLTLNRKDPNAIQVFYKGNQLNLSQKAVIKEGRTLLPVRALSEYFGFTVAWNAAEKEIILSKDDKSVIMYIDKTTAMINGNETKIDSPPTLINNSTYVPVRFICENLGLEVNWYQADKIVELK